MKKILLLIIVIGCFGWLSSLEYEAAKTSADYDSQMKANVKRVQELKDAGIYPYDY